MQIADALEQEPDRKLFDLVIGNPPYGRMSLTPDQRSCFARSLYGHANLYGVFTDIDFIEARRGVFEDVLQEALLATYRRGGKVNSTAVHYLAVTSKSSAQISHAGRFTVPDKPDGPWL